MIARRVFFARILNSRRRSGLRANPPKTRGGKLCYKERRPIANNETDYYHRAPYFFHKLSFDLFANLCKIDVTDSSRIFVTTAAESSRMFCSNRVRVCSFSPDNLLLFELELEPSKTCWIIVSVYPKCIEQVSFVCSCCQKPDLLLIYFWHDLGKSGCHQNFWQKALWDIFRDSISESKHFMMMWRPVLNLNDFWKFLKRRHDLRACPLSRMRGEKQHFAVVVNWASPFISHAATFFSCVVPI